MSEVSQEVTASTLYLIATPIGNLADWSPRAQRVASAVNAILAEDTRVTGLLLHEFNITTPMISFHAHNWQRRIPEVLQRLAQGWSLALISDRGMPAISDPGQELVDAVWAEGYRVSVVPGPSALTTAFAGSGFPHPFVFWGFLPTRGQERQKALAVLAGLPYTAILFEAPHRLERTLRDLAEALGPSRPAVLAREMTKRFEEFRRSTLGALCEEGTGWRGEIVLVVGPPAAGRGGPPPDWHTLCAEVKERVQRGEKEKEAVSQVASTHGVAKRELYRQVQQGKSSCD